MDVAAIPIHHSVCEKTNVWQLLRFAAWANKPQWNIKEWWNKIEKWDKADTANTNAIKD